MMNRKSRNVSGISLSLLFFAVFTFASTAAPAGSPGNGAGAPDRAGPVAETRATKKKAKKLFVEQELLVRFKKGVSKEKARKAHDKINARVLKEYRNIPGLYHVKLPKKTALGKGIDYYKKHAAIAYVEPNYMYHTLGIPNDPSFSSLWGLHNTGQTSGTADADINAPEAWDITTGSADTIIAVIDTGVDYNHPDLSANIWTNPGEIAGNGIDDDGNGYIDDMHGINTITGSGNPMDDHNHGTHVSGTIAASGNNGLGVAGVNWQAKIVGCKFLSSSGSGTTDDAVECLDYLYGLKTRATNPVNIVLSSNSWGGGGFSQALSDAIAANGQAGILFIAAAGNSSANTDLYPHYPSSYYQPNIISVAATDHNDAFASFTNYGRYSVHIAAPGVNILSTTINNTYSSFSGTSMATPHVSGLIGLLKAQDPTRDWKALKNLVLAGGQDNAAAANDTVTGKRIRAYDINGVGSLSCMDQVVQSRIRPMGASAGANVGEPLDLSVLNINCGASNGNVSVSVSDGSTVVLTDDGTGIDQEAGDGVASGQWTPQSLGTYTLGFPGGDAVTVTVVENYTPVETTYDYRAITGTNLLLSDDSSALITAPFPIHFAGDPNGYTSVYVSSNGTVNFTASNRSYSNGALPAAGFTTLVAPFWDDLNPGSGGGVYWEVLGMAPNRELVVEWRDVPHYSNIGAATFQVVLFENSSNILMNYADVEFENVSYNGGASATVGVQIAAQSARQYSVNQPVLLNGLAILWQLRNLTADAGPDQFVLPGASVTLDGSGSRGSGMTITGYLWEQTAGTPVTISGADTATPGFTAPVAYETLTFRLTVTSDTGETASDTVNVTVNDPPVANAGPDQTAIAYFIVSLDGSASHDPNGTIASYDWVQTAGTTVTLSGAGTATPTFTAPNTPGTLSFQLTVTDDSGQTAADSVSVLVKTPPVVDAGLDQFVLPGAAVTLNGSGSHDPDGAIVSYVWTQSAGTPVTLTGADTVSPGFTAPAGNHLLTFQLAVTDNDGYASTDSVNVVVNIPPVANAGPDQTAVSGAIVTLDGAGSADPDGTIAAYGWVQTAGTTVPLTGATTATPSFTAPTTAGVLIFQLTVTDNSGQTAVDTVTVSILTPPVSNAGADQTVLAGTAVTLSGSGSYDPDGTITGYSWVQTSGSPVTLVGADTVSPSFTAPIVTGALVFELTVTDNIGLTAADSVTVTVADTYRPAVEIDYDPRTIVGTNLLLRDDSSTAITSPFPIRYANHSSGYTTVYVSSNGTVNFTTSNSSLSNSTLPTTSFTTLVAPFWDDLNPGSGGGVYWEVIGTAPNRELVIEWRNVPHYPYTGAATFQVVFFENSPMILFNYADVLFGTTSYDEGASATIGVQVSPTLHRQYSYNTASLHNNMTLVWRTTQQPEPNAGPDQFAQPGSTVTLDGTASYDPNGTITSHHWVQTAGDPMTLVGADTATPSFIAPALKQVLSFTLTVTDDSGEYGSDSVNVVVNIPPLANAGLDQAAVSGTIVTLDGAGSSDPDGTIAGYSWVQTAGTAVTLTGAATATPTFTAPNTPGSLTFQLTVTDDSGQTAVDSLSVLVKIPPVSNAGPDQHALPGSAVSLDGSASYDADGTIASYAWTQSTGTPVTLTGADTASPGFTAPAASGTLTFQLTVTDNDGYSSTDSVNVVVNIPPLADAGLDQAAVSGTIVTLDGAGSSDPDGTIAGYSWVQTAGTTVSLTGATTATPSFTAPTTAGVLTFQLTVTDNSGQIGVDTVSVTILVAPVANAGPDQIVAKDSDVSLSGSSSYDPDGTIAGYNWVQTAGPSVTLVGADTVSPSFTAPAADVLIFELTVTDNSGLIAADSVTVTVVDTYRPAVEIDYDPRSIVGTNLFLRDDSSAAITSPFPIRYANHPSGYTTVYVSSNGTVNFTASNSSLSNSALPTTSFATLVAPFWDDLNPGSGGGVYWEVIGTAPNRELVIEWRNVPHYPYTGAATFQAVFFENSPAILYNYADVLFEYASYDGGASATIGTQVSPTLYRQYSYNTASLHNNMTLLWNINEPPTANAGIDQESLTGDTVILDGTASSDPNGVIAGYSWTQIAGTPVTITNGSSATASFVAPDGPGTLTFSLTVIDDFGESADDTVNVTINNRLPVANAGVDQTVLVNAAVTLDGSASADADGTIASYSWAQIAGTAATLTGADTVAPGFTAPATGGALTFQLTVTDNNGANSSDTVIVTVNEPPTANAGVDQTVLVNASVILDGTGSADADGTIASYSWAQIAGTAVTLTGADTTAPGFTAPATGGALTFQLTVTDNIGASASDMVTVIVNEAPTANAGSDQTVLVNASVTLDGTGSADADGTIASYSWAQIAGTAVTLTGADTTAPGFTAPATGGALTFQLTVTDNNGASASDMVTVIVNEPPTANAGPDTTVKIKSTVLLDGTASADADGTIAGYRWVQTAGTAVSLVNGTTASPSFTAPGSADILTFQLTVTDNNGASALDTVTINVTPSGK